MLQKQIIQNIIFPGYYKNKNYRIYTVRNNLSMQLEDVLYNLSKQISIVIKYLPEYKDAEEKELRREGEKLALQFLERLVKIRELLQTDLQAAYDGDPAVIEDNVTVYAGASILGGDTVIGHDTVIGGNAFITTSIPSNTRVSIKNQELEYKQGKRNVTELGQSEEWYYMI